MIARWPRIPARPRGFHPSAMVPRGLAAPHGAAVVAAGQLPPGRRAAGALSGRRCGGAGGAVHRLLDRLGRVARPLVDLLLPGLLRLVDLVGRLVGRLVHLLLAGLLRVIDLLVGLALGLVHLLLAAGGLVVDRFLRLLARLLRVGPLLLRGLLALGGAVVESLLLGRLRFVGD